MASDLFLKFKHLGVVHKLLDVIERALEIRDKVLAEFVLSLALKTSSVMQFEAMLAESGAEFSVELISSMYAIITKMLPENFERKQVVKIEAENDPILAAEIQQSKEAVAEQSLKKQELAARFPSLAQRNQKDKDEIDLGFDDESEPGLKEEETTKDAGSIRVKKQREEDPRARSRSRDSSRDRPRRRSRSSSRRRSESPRDRRHRSYRRSRSRSPRRRSRSPRRRSRSRSPRRFPRDYMPFTVGGIYQGKVMNLKPFGLFVRIRDPESGFEREGLVHIGKIRPGRERLERPEDAGYARGDTVYVKLAEIRDDQKMSLSMQDCDQHTGLEATRLQDGRKLLKHSLA